jgi:hypothetical protein
MPRPNRVVDSLASYSPKSVAADSGTLSRWREYPKRGSENPVLWKRPVPLLGHSRQADIGSNSGLPVNRALADFRLLVASHSARLPDARLTCEPTGTEEYLHENQIRAFV